MNLKHLLEQLTEGIEASIKQRAPDGQIRRAEVGAIIIANAVALVSALGVPRAEVEAALVMIMANYGGTPGEEVKARRSLIHVVEKPEEPV